MEVQSCHRTGRRVVEGRFRVRLAGEPQSSSAVRSHSIRPRCRARSHAKCASYVHVVFCRTRRHTLGSITQFPRTSLNPSGNPAAKPTLGGSQFDVAPIPSRCHICSGPLASGDRAALLTCIVGGLDPHGTTIVHPSARCFIVFFVSRVHPTANIESLRVDDLPMPL